MVAGSRTGGTRGQAGDAFPVLIGRARGWALASSGTSARVWPMLAGLYLLATAALLLPWPFGAHPPWAYNWEGYTAWRWEQYWTRPGGWPLEILAPTDGLMTDSGQGPLLGLPMTAGIALGGFNLDAMRVPVTLLAALAVPVLWLLGRTVAGSGPATLAAVLLASAPPFLFYGRTATLVGVSLLPLLLSALALARVLDPRVASGWRWSREGLLAASLMLGIFAYAPVRLFWPVSVGLLGVAALRRPKRRGALLGTAVICLLTVPLTVAALDWLTSPDPRPLAAATGYFHARGEQLVAMGEHPDEAGQYVRDLGGTDASGRDAALLLVGQNTRDLLRLLLDRDTLPVPADYWNERGRFWPWFLLPFAVVGASMATVRAVRGGPGATLRMLPLAACLGLMLPLLLTSRVHIGRLLPALPFALLVAAAGVWVVAGWLSGLAWRAGGGNAFSTGLIGPVLAGALLLPAIAVGQSEMAAPLAESREARTAAVIAGWSAEASERGGAVLVEDPALGDDIERVHAATYRLQLDRIYRFVDLQGADALAVSPDPRPALLWRGALAALRAGAIDQPCGRLWFVGPEIAQEFFASWREAGCIGVPDSVVLP